MVRIAAEKLESALSRLKALEEKKQSEYSLRELIKQILPNIQSVIKKGYSFDEVANLLKQDEINISETTLRQYVREFSKDSKDKSSGIKAKKNQDKSSKAELVVAQKKIENTKVSVVKNDKVALRDEPYKSPPKPGSEQFK